MTRALISSIVILGVACGGSSTSAETPAPTAAAAQPGVPVGMGVAASSSTVGLIILSNPTAIAALAAADGADGKVDMVVANCAACGLAMKGDAAHASKIGDYTLHSCSDRCKLKLEENPDELLGNLEIAGSE